MPTDTERLNFLQSLLFGKVICRDSTRGRGFRLHQTRSAKHTSFDSVRDAIDFYKNTKPKQKEERCSCKNPKRIESFFDFCGNCSKLL